MEIHEIEMHKQDIISSFIELGSRLDQTISQDDGLFERAYLKNNWFTADNIALCFENWSKNLQKESLSSWLGESDWRNGKKVGIVMAGNIPLVGLHDLLAVLGTGHYAKIKLSSSDDILMNWLIRQLIEIQPKFEDRIEIVERLKGIDAVLATGSNNTSRYFEYYFKSIPSVIRKNRTGVAVLDGNENKDDLINLGRDIFQYFGLGCRNVSKIYVPEKYDFTDFIVANEPYQDLINHNKYANNYTYHKAIFLMNMTPHLDSGYLLLKEDGNLHAPLGCTFYQHYQNIDSIVDKLYGLKSEIQCVVSNGLIPDSIGFGTTQSPSLQTYADGIDTKTFLSGI